MYWQGIANQVANHPLYDASGTIAAGGTAQLLLPQHPSRSYLVIQNISDTAMYVDFGAARAGAVTISSGVITAVAVGNAGLGYSLPPRVIVLGGGSGATGGYLSGAGPNFPAPTAASGGRPAVIRAVMTGSAPTQTVASFVVEDGGAGYVATPLVQLFNSPLDPGGVAAASATSGILLAANGGNLAFTSGFCPTDPVSIFCATISKAFTCKYAP